MLRAKLVPECRRESKIRRLTATEPTAALIRPDELANLPPTQVSDEGKYLFDRTLGLMREVTVNRRVSVSNASRLDNWQIRLVEGPKR